MKHTTNFEFTLINRVKRHGKFLRNATEKIDLIYNSIHVLCWQCGAKTLTENIYSGLLRQVVIEKNKKLIVKKLHENIVSLLLPILKYICLEIVGCLTQVISSE